jgi:hypothetical protein
VLEELIEDISQVCPELRLSARRSYLTHLNVQQKGGPCDTTLDRTSDTAVWSRFETCLGTLLRCQIASVAGQ